MKRQLCLFGRRIALFSNDVASGRRSNHFQVGSRRASRARNLFRPRVESLEQRAMLAASITNFALDDDTGSSSSDEITSDPTVEGNVSWSAPTVKVRMEFDHDGDGTKEGSVLVLTSGNQFVYDPLSVDSSLNSHEGSLTIDYRAVEIDGSQSETTGSWQAFTFTLDRVAPSVSTFTPSSSVVLETEPSAVTVLFHEDVTALATGGVYVEEQSSSSQPMQESEQVASDKVSVTFWDPLDAVTFVTQVDDYEDAAGNLLVSASVTWRLNEAPTTLGISDVDVDEDAADTVLSLWNFFDDTYDADSALTYSVTGNTNTGLFDSTGINAGNGQLTLDYAENVYGNSTITVRATDSTLAYVETSYVVTINAMNDPPNITGFSATHEGNVLTFSGTVADPDDDVSTMTIQFSGLFTGTASVDANGSFTKVKVLYESGVVTVDTEDDENAASNVAEYTVVFGS